LHRSKKPVQSKIRQFRREYEEKIGSILTTCRILSSLL
jgi:hypothetical protein